MAKENRQQPSYEELAEVVHEVAFRPRAPGFDALMDWYVEQHPKLTELWRRAREDLGGGLTLLDLAEIQRINTDGGRVPSLRRTGNLVKLYRLDPRTRAMWAGIEQTARDAGLYERWPASVQQAAVYHREITELLAERNVQAFVVAKREQPWDLEVYLAILEQRLHRREGDFEVVREVHDALRRRISRPPVEVLGAGEGPETARDNDVPTSDLGARQSGKRRKGSA